VTDDLRDYKHTHTHTNTQNINRYTLFQKGLWKGERLNETIQHVIFQETAQPPISPLFHFIPMGREKGNKKPCTSLFTEMVSKGWRTQVLYTRQDMT